MIRLLIADDHAIVREGLKKIFALTPDIKSVAEASDGGEILKLLNGPEKIDLLLLDLTMPGVSGTDMISHLKSHYSSLPIVVFSMHNEPQVAMRAVRAGADGYIAKDCNPEVLLEAIRKVAVGGKYIDPLLAEQLAYEAVFSGQRPPHSQLTERELEVFRLLVSGNLINAIADKLAISNKTVSTHKLKLMEKMKVDSVADLVRYAIQHNLFH
jgi:DNA-binding NarL/FixJ family response regulator